MSFRFYPNYFSKICDFIINILFFLTSFNLNIGFTVHKLQISSPTKNGNNTEDASVRRLAEVNSCLFGCDIRNPTPPIIRAHISMKDA